MAKQIGIVVAGVVISFLSSAASGYILYRLHGTWPEHVQGEAARYVLDPLDAFIVGTCVGLLMRKNAALLAALSVLPVLAYPFIFGIFGQKLDRTDALRSVPIIIVYLAVATTFAALVSKRLSKSKPQANN